ncbi:NAD(P)-dependent oxidoreductase [Acuticoccus sp.]|uniref:NAD(P)-dependent oxidoreductase n=1 Tax=Acuticoccus sp. TaxID=1904378 RepID=UPI003B51FD7E
MSTPEPRARVFVLDEVHPAAMDRLSARAEVFGPDRAGDWEAQADAVIVRNSRIDAAAIERAARLRVIGKHGVGTDNIDVDAARAGGIAVLTTPGANAEPVADLAVGYALALLRNIAGHTAALRAGRPLRGDARVGLDLAEVPAGIVGLGAVGSRVAHRLVHGFGARVAAVDPAIADADWPREVARSATLEELLDQSSLIFLHVPLDGTTRHMIDRARLALMPQGSYLVNCARGGIVDEAALAEALASGQLAGAASDVFELEPPAPDHPLLQIEGFLATPHIGASTHRGLQQVGITIADKVLGYLAGPDAASDHAATQRREAR